MSTSSNAIYATQEDIEIIFGETNVRKWADVDNDENETLISNRIVWALERAEAWVNARLRGGPYAIPFSTPIPELITDVTARQAGVLLYDARRIVDEGEDADEVPTHRREVEKIINQIHARQIRLDVTLNCTAHPKVL